MSPLLTLSRLIDRCSEWVGRWVAWLVLAAVLISAANAIVRKALNMSSNGFLEIQWYLFAAVFLLASGYTLMRQEHVRIDVLLTRFPKRTQIWIDIFGICCFLFPFVVIVIDLSWPLVARAWTSGEMSSNAGGLIRWPVFALLPAGMALLGLQGVSELIKRIAFLRGLIDDPTRRHQTKSVEEELAEFLAKQQGVSAAAVVHAEPGHD
ncbi:MAG TPA: TRAP transporter small permease subunit [Caldimonas sp.]|nr:TRAP transporter small permease subunit [Caldimonas sp.]